MKIWAWIIIGFFTWCIASTYIAYDFMLEAKPAQFLNNSISVENKSQTETIKVEGVEYLVVETRNGVGVTFKLNKNNLRKLAEMVSEISDEMDSEKFNNIIQDK
tara:strand:+ start:2515 stop:2826 length:312 start_codon:yes stop_codon:yes gene_type:complete